jgi:WD40 repeat protein
LLERITTATSESKAVEILVALPDEEFRRFQTDPYLPDSLRMDQESLNKLGLATLKKVVERSARRRKELATEKAAAEAAAARAASAGKEFWTACLGELLAVAIEVSPDGRRVAVLGDEGDDSIWSLSCFDADTGDKCWQHKPLTGDLLCVQPLAFSGNGRYLGAAATITMERRLLLFATDNGKIERTFRAPVANWSPRSVGLSLDGKYALLGGEDLNGKGSVYVWNTSSGQLVTEFRGHSKQVTGIAVTPDGRGVVTCGEDRVVIRWEIATGREVMLYDAHSHRVDDVAVSPDGKLILSTARSTIVLGSRMAGEIILWSLESGKRLCTWDNLWAENVEFLPDGTRIMFQPPRHSSRAELWVGFKLQPEFFQLSNPKTPLKLVDMTGSWMHYRSHLWRIHPEGDRIFAVAYRKERNRGETSTVSYLRAVGFP